MNDVLTRRSSECRRLTKGNERWRANGRIAGHDDRPLIDSFENVAAHDVAGRAHGDYRAVVQQHHRCGEAGDEIELMTDEQYGVAIPGERIEQLEHRHLVRDVEERR